MKTLLAGAMDAKALLDSLMGTGRDKPKAEKRDDDWKEKKVCKFFLVGFCPTAENDNWFHNTKSGVVEICKKTHSEHLKADFDKHPDRSKYQREYEADFLKYLQGLIASADARVAREKQNCKDANSKTRSIVKVPDSLKWQYDKMLADKRHQLNDATMLERAGQIEASRGLTERANKLGDEIRVLEEQHTVTSAGDCVCDVCGVRCSMDDERLYEGHVSSNLHSAYVKIRDKAKELREKRQGDDGASSDRRDDKDNNREDRSNRDRDRSSDRSHRDRDDRSYRGRDRDGDRERDRGRGKDSQRGGDRRRSDRSRSR